MTEQVSIRAVQERIITDMSGLDEGLGRYEYLIVLGKTHRPDPSLHTEANLISGCQANAWARSELVEGKLHFEADSESMIIRGILVLLLRILNHRCPEEVVSADLFFLRETSIMGSLSPTRANGLESIIRQFHSFAEQASRTNEV